MFFNMSIPAWEMAFLSASEIVYCKNFRASSCEYELDIKCSIFLIGALFLSTGGRKFMPASLE